MEIRRQPHHPNDSQVKRHGSAVSFAQPSVGVTALATVPVTATATLAKSPYVVPSTYSAPAVQWMRGKNLDFCLLAVCSCVLAILCHQTVHLPFSQSAPASSLASSSRVWPSQLDFMLKAGLFTSSHQRSEGEEEIAE